MTTVNKKNTKKIKIHIKSNPNINGNKNSFSTIIPKIINGKFTKQERHIANIVGSNLNIYKPRA